MRKQIKDRIKLQTYLNDHLAGAVVATNLAKRAAKENQGNEFGEYLTHLGEQIEEDKKSLETIMKQLGLMQNPLKKNVPWLAERLGRLKLNGELTRYSSLSRLEEFEGLVLGVHGKLNFWATLATYFVDDPRLSSINFADLITRAESQAQRLEQYRVQAAEHVFQQAA